MARFIQMVQSDSVATALGDVKVGETGTVYSKNNEELFQICPHEDIPFGNKVALRDIALGSKIIKYGAPIGICTQDIKTGYLVHVHNVKSLKVDIPPAICAEIMRQMNYKKEAVEE